MESKWTSARDHEVRKEESRTSADRENRARQVYMCVAARGSKLGATLPVRRKERGVGSTRGSSRREIHKSSDSQTENATPTAEGGKGDLETVKKNYLGEQAKLHEGETTLESEHELQKNSELAYGKKMKRPHKRQRTTHQSEIVISQNRMQIKKKLRGRGSVAVFHSQGIP